MDTKELKPVAWMDDGSLRAGSHGVATRVVTDEAQAEATNIRARLANTEDALRCARDQLAYVLSGPFGTLVEAKLIAKIDAALTEEPSHERSFERPSGY